MSLVCFLVEKFLNFLSIVNGKKIRFVAAWSACLVEKKKIQNSNRKPWIYGLFYLSTLLIFNLVQRGRVTYKGVRLECICADFFF
jgi:hypothetical protein